MAERPASPDHSGNFTENVGDPPGRELNSTAARDLLGCTIRPRRNGFVYCIAMNNALHVQLRALKPNRNGVMAMRAPSPNNARQARATPSRF